MILTVIKLKVSGDREDFKGEFYKFYTSISVYRPWGVAYYMWKKLYKTFCGSIGSGAKSDKCPQVSLNW